MTSNFSSTPNLPINNTPRPLPLFHGDYRENEEPSTWFAQFQLSLPDNYSDLRRIQRFAMQLAPGYMADQWFNGLPPSSITSFLDLRAAFQQRWPPPKPPAYSRAQQKERIMAQVLKEEDIGIWTADGATGNYGHVVWAHKVMRLALGMGDVAGFLIESALENVPNMLKDHLTCDYSTWQEFVDDVENVPAVKLKRAREELDKERLRDADIARLKAQSVSTPPPLETNGSRLAYRVPHATPSPHPLTSHRHPLSAHSLHIQLYVDQPHEETYLQIVPHCLARKS